MWSLLFLLVLIAQEFAVLYCAFKLLSERSQAGSKKPSAVLHAPLPDFAKVKIQPDSTFLCPEAAYASCMPQTDLKSCRKRMVQKSMAARA